jgi:hypothetical protein
VISWNLDKYQGETQPGEEYTFETTDTFADEEGAISDSDKDWPSRLIQDFEIILDKKSQEITWGIEVWDLTVKVPVVTIFPTLIGNPEPDLSTKSEPEQRQILDSPEVK